MSTITAKPRIGKEPRAKLPLASPAMQREINDARPTAEWRSWAREGLQAFAVNVALRELPGLGQTMRNARGDDDAGDVASIACALLSATETNGLTVRGSGIGLHVLGPDFKEVAKFTYAELLDAFRFCSLHRPIDPGKVKPEKKKKAAATSPDETGTTTPAGIRRNDPDAQLEDMGLLTPANGRPTKGPREEMTQAAAAKEERNFGGKVTSRIKLKSCIRHPINRIPTQAEIDDLAENMKVEGMLEKPVVRLNGPGGIQILSGETRILAAKKLGWHEADMETVHCDDARALELLAIYNAKRTDLNPIQKAQLIHQLCLPKVEGGSGMTREAAGNIYKLKSDSSASNLVRLLELPQVWQDRVSSGELPESFARTLLRVSHAPRLMDILEKSWERHHANKQCPFCTTRHSFGSCWASREWMEVTVEKLVDDLTRPMKDGSEFHYSYNELHGKLQNYYHFSADYPMLFDADAALEAKLEIHEFTLDKKPARRATNIALYDKLQIPLIKAFVEKRAKKEAERSGRDKLGRNKPGKKREPTPAEKKAAAAAKTKQLGERIAAWRHKLLRRACSQAVEDEQDSGLRVVLGHAADRCVPHGGLSYTEALLEVRKVQPRSRGYSLEYWPVVAAIQDNSSSMVGDAEGVVVAKLAQTILAHESKDWHRPTLPHSFVESYAEDLDVNLKQEWLELQRDELTGQPDPLLEEFFLLHQTDQLRGLAKELGVFASETANKPAIVKLLLGSLRGGSNRRLPLPKSIKLVGTRKKGAK